MKIKKLFASVLGAAFAMSFCFGAVSAQAAEKEYKGSELVALPAEQQMGEIAFATEGDAVNVTIPSQWNQAVFEIPAEVLAAGLESATFNLEGADNCTLKFIGHRGEALIGIIASYNTPGKLVVDAANLDPWGGDPVATADEIGLIEYIDLMNGSTDPITVKINSVVFTTTNEIASAEAPAEETPTEAPAEETPTEAPAEDTTTTLPNTGLVSGAAFLVAGAVMMLGGAVVAKKKED